MRIEDTTILITDDSILARKQLKDIISTPALRYSWKPPMDRVQLTNIKKYIRIWYFLTLLCQKKTAMMPSVILWNLIRKLQSSSLLLSEHSPS